MAEVGAHAVAIGAGNCGQPGCNGGKLVGHVSSDDLPIAVAVGAIGGPVAVRQALANEDTGTRVAPAGVRPGDGRQQLPVDAGSRSGVSN